MNIRERMYRILENVVPSGGPIAPVRGTWFPTARDGKLSPKKRAKNPLKLLRAKPKTEIAQTDLPGLRVSDFRQPQGPVRASRPWDFFGENIDAVSLGTQAPKVTKGLGSKSGPFSHYPYIGIPGGKEMMLRDLKVTARILRKAKARTGGPPIPIDGTAR